jgi:hypothetical protein
MVGLHDYPQFLADWSKLLTDHGARRRQPALSGRARTGRHRRHGRILGDAGYMTADERAVLETFVKRGGGFVSFHDTLCGDDTPYRGVSRRRQKHGSRALGRRIKSRSSTRRRRS